MITFGRAPQIRRGFAGIRRAPLELFSFNFFIELVVADSPFMLGPPWNSSTPSHGLSP